VFFPRAQLREHERPADERGGFDAQDAITKVSESETGGT
jgi:hypothetical protein